MIISKHQNKSMNEYLQLLIKIFCYLQYDLNEKSHIDTFIHNKLITICQNVFACQYVCFKFFDILIDFINEHLHQIENYQFEIYFIDQRYKYFKK